MLAKRLYHLLICIDKVPSKLKNLRTLLQKRIKLVRRLDWGKHTQNILGLSGQARFGTLGDRMKVEGKRKLVIQVSIAFGTEG